MRSFIRATGIFIVAAGLGVLLAPKASVLAQQAGDAFHDQARAILTQAQATIAGASPTMAAHLATILIIAAASAGMMIAYLVVSVPMRLYSMKRHISRQDEKIESLEDQVRLSKELLMEARRDFQTQLERVRINAVGNPASGGAPAPSRPTPSRVDRFIFPQGVPEVQPAERSNF